MIVVELSYNKSHGAQTDVGNREFLHEYNAVCGKTGVKHHCRTTLNLKSR